MTSLPPWVFACKGKLRPGDSAGMSDIHVWRRDVDGTAHCVKCSVRLTKAEADDCYQGLRNG